VPVDNRVARAHVCVAGGAYGEAVGLFELALKELEATAGPESLPVARLLNELGVACKFAGRLDEAERYYTRAVRLVDKHESAECEDMATLLHNLGGLAHTAAVRPYLLLRR
jgi:tetratricopeptide (TPR) repeat protein